MAKGLSFCIPSLGGSHSLLNFGDCLLEYFVYEACLSPLVNALSSVGPRRALDRRPNPIPHDRTCHYIDIISFFDLVEIDYRIVSCEEIL